MLHAAPLINLGRPGRVGHGQALPAPQLLDRAQVYPSHHEPGAESMAVAVPRVAVELLGALAGPFPGPAWLGLSEDATSWDTEHPNRVPARSRAIIASHATTRTAGQWLSYSIT